MSEISATDRRRIINLERLICGIANFDAHNWTEIGILTDCTSTIKNHPRLLRSLGFGDDDYDDCVCEVLLEISGKNSTFLDRIENYLVHTFSVKNNLALLNKCVCSPEVFKIPDEEQSGRLIALIMPFDARLTAVTVAIKEVVDSVSLECKRADDIWKDATIIQDIFYLIYTSAAVICDMSGRNPNVLYETGIAHMLGRKVIPLTQNLNDIPFDMRHHRSIVYDMSDVGISNLKTSLRRKLMDEIPNATLKTRECPF